MIQKYSSAFFFYKSLLRKVSFNAYLFEKELNKALSVLSKHEGTRLYRWAMSYNKNHPIFQAAFWKGLWLGWAYYLDVVEFDRPTYDTAYCGSQGLNNGEFQLALKVDQAHFSRRSRVGKKS